MPKSNPYERHMREQTATIEKLKGEIEKLTRTNTVKDKVIEAFKTKYQFKSLKGRSTMIVKLGSREMKWLPGPAHFAAATKQIKGAKLDEKYNIVLVNAFYSFELQA